MRKVILTWYVENISGIVLLFKISENLLEFKLLKTSRKAPYFEENQLCLWAWLIYAFTEFAYDSKLLIKIRSFLKKNNSYFQKYKLACRFEGFKLEQISCNFETFKFQIFSVHSTT